MGFSVVTIKKIPDTIVWVLAVVNWTNWSFCSLFFLIEKVCFTRKSNQLTRFSDPSVCISFENERNRLINSRKTTSSVFVAHMKFELSSKIKEKQKTKSQTNKPNIQPTLMSSTVCSQILSGEVKALLWADIMQEVSIQILHVCEELCVRDRSLPDSCNSG